MLIVHRRLYSWPMWGLTNIPVPGENFLLTTTPLKKLLCNIFRSKMVFTTTPVKTENNTQISSYQRSKNSFSVTTDRFQHKNKQLAFSAVYIKPVNNDGLYIALFTLLPRIQELCLSCGYFTSYGLILLGLFDVVFFRTELLKLLLTCFSEVMYLPPSSDSSNTNPWVQFFCSTENRWEVVNYLWWILWSSGLIHTLSFQKPHIDICNSVYLYSVLLSKPPKVSICPLTLLFLL